VNWTALRFASEIPSTPDPIQRLYHKSACFVSHMLEEMRMRSPILQEERPRMLKLFALSTQATDGAGMSHFNGRFVGLPRCSSMTFGEFLKMPCRIAC
jgi:hypothetical protein